MHVVVPIARRSSWDEVTAFARAVGYRIAREASESYLARASKAERKGKIFIDWLRNTRGATAIAPWSSRAREGAPVSMPVSWEELGKVRSGDQYSVESALALMRRRKQGPWASMLKAKQRLSRSMTAALEA